MNRNKTQKAIKHYFKIVSSVAWLQLHCYPQHDLSAEGYPLVTLEVDMSIFLCYVVMKFSYYFFVKITETFTYTVCHDSISS